MDEKDKIPEILTMHAPRPVVSTILNGIGNGAMIGGGLFSIPEVVRKLSNPQHITSHKYFRTTMAATTVGAVIGAYFSYKTKDINDYRTALKQDLENLHSRLNATESAHSL